MGKVKNIYLIQTIILIRLLWLPGISKICVSFADKYTLQRHEINLIMSIVSIGGCPVQMFSYDLDFRSFISC